MSLASTGAGVKNLAIGAAVLLGVGAVIYLVWKSKQTAEKAAGYLFSGDKAERTLGTDIADAILPDAKVGVIDPGSMTGAERQKLRQQCEIIYPKGSGKRPKPPGPCYQVLGPDWNA